jgi:hypothetical protein
MSEIPFISRNNSAAEYCLYFKIPIKEYEQMKSKLSKVDHATFEKFAKSICEEHGVRTLDACYPKLRWNAEGELEGMLVGVNCACVSKESNVSDIAYTFHNIVGADQALAALQILAKFYSGLQIL